MKSSYKIAILIAALLVVIGVGYYLARDGGEHSPIDAAGPGAGADEQATQVRRPPAVRPPATDVADDTAAGDDATATAPPTPSADIADADDGSPTAGNPLLAELRASLAAAHGRTATGAAATGDADSPTRDTDATDADAANLTATAPAPGATATAAADGDTADAATSATSSREPEDATARANDPLAIAAGGGASSAGSSSATASTATTAKLSSNSSSLARANTASQTAVSASTAIGPEPGVPYFGPLPGDDAETTAMDAAPAAAPAAATPSSYTIKAGDTFSSIAAALYHDASRWNDIAQANPLVDPNRLKVGQEIRLPGAETAARRAEPDAAVVAAGREGGTVPYVIRSSDTLSTIAQQFYGNPSQWRVIFEANRHTLGDNPDRIRVGQKIIIPPAPRRAQ